MTDLIARLRTRNGRADGFGLGPACDEAADKIEQLMAERDMWKDTLAQRDRELSNARAVDIHSCHAYCTRAGCVNGRLRAAIAESLRMADNWPEGAQAVLQDALEGKL